MTRVALYSNHIIPSKDNGHAQTLLDYIATRDGVALNEEKKMTQQELIASIIQTNPQVINVCDTEYDKYIESGNKFIASKFITSAMEYIASQSESPEIYLKYISHRKGVVKSENTDHGLFNQNGIADLKQKQKNLQQQIENNPDAPIFNHIISLRREDAIEFGYDNQESWKKLLQAQMPLIANDMHIDLNDVVWNAAFHDEGHHPHVHIQMYSKNTDKGYVSVYTLEKIKSRIANQIFKAELDVLKTQRTNLRNEFEYEVKQAIQEWKAQVDNPITKDLQLDHSDLQRITEHIKTGAFKYQSREVKDDLKDMLQQIIDTPNIQVAIDRMYQNYHAFETYYKDEESKFTTQSKFQQMLLDGKVGDRFVIHNFLLDTLKGQSQIIDEPSIINLTEEQMNRLEKNSVDAAATISKIKNKKYTIDTHEKAIKELTKKLCSTQTFDLNTIDGKTRDELLQYACSIDVMQNQFSTYIDAKSKLLNTSTEETLRMFHNAEIGSELYRSIDIAIAKQFKQQKQGIMLQAIRKMEDDSFTIAAVKPLAKAMIYAELPNSEINERMTTYISSSHLNVFDQYTLYQKTMREILQEKNEHGNKLVFSKDENKLLYKNYYQASNNNQEQPRRATYVAQRTVVSFLSSISYALERSGKESIQDSAQSQRMTDRRNKTNRNKSNRKRGISYV